MNPIVVKTDSWYYQFATAFRRDIYNSWSYKPPHDTCAFVRSCVMTVSLALLAILLIRVFLLDPLMWFYTCLMYGAFYFPTPDIFAGWGIGIYGFVTFGLFLYYMIEHGIPDTWNFFVTKVIEPIAESFPSSFWKIFLAWVDKVCIPIKYENKTTSNPDEGFE